MRINVLDHGFARLVDHMGTDLSIVRAARVSFDADWRAGDNEKNDTKLINYLWKNKHSTPFEAVTFTFEVKAPIFVIRQWHRHRTWTYNEVSARYTELPEEFYIPAMDKLGKQSSANKQGRDLSIDFSLEEKEKVIDMIQDVNKEAFRTYQNLIERGVSRELARSVLPVSTYTRMFATVNLLNLLKFLTLRCDEHAQYEIRVYADAIAKLIQPIVPVTMNAWLTHK